jgi:hypothetical protein
MHIFVPILALIAVFAPQINHVVWCIDAADKTGSAIALLIAGFVIFPVGWLHGISIWFGYPWL